MLAPPVPGARRFSAAQPWDLADHVDHDLIRRAEPALAGGKHVELALPIDNSRRAVGTLLSGEIARRFGAKGLPDGSVQVRLSGSAGQSFGAFLAPGVSLELCGDANDYIGKGMSGGRIVVYPPATARFAPDANVIIGNVALYGATAGDLFACGLAGERFAVRNSGARAVVEGVGDHGCEYMTGGVVVVLGPVGRNFAAGMSGGTAYVYDPTQTLRARTQPRDGRARERDRRERHVARPLDDRGARPVHREPARAPGDGQLGAPGRAVRQGDADRLQARAAGAARGGPPAPGAHPRRRRPALVGKPTGFIEWPRLVPRKRPVAERLRDWREVEGPHGPLEEDVTRAQAGRCMDCGVPFCTQGCPLGNPIPEFADLVWRERWRDAHARLASTNDFPEFTGRLCPAPCEGSCVLGIDHAPVTIEAIEKAIAERAFSEGWIVPHPPRVRTGKRIAIVGSGPAGLAAANQLNRAGHTAIVYEAAARAGGLLRYGIPDFKLEKDVIDRRLAILEAEGVELRLGVTVGTDPTWAQLRADHDALVIATGAPRARDLDVPGRELAGVILAMDYLTEQNQVLGGERTSAPHDVRDRRVVILGGGDTGSDCLGTALRQGAREVTQIELLPAPPADRAPGNPWPAWPMVFRTSSSQEEGGERTFAFRTTRLEGDGGALSSLVGVPVDGAAPPGAEVRIPVDTLILALGFTGPDTAALVDQLGVALDPRGNVAIDARYQTSVPGVYCAGDAHRGASLIVWAIAEGRELARAIDGQLRASPSIVPARGQDLPFR